MEFQAKTMRWHGFKEVQIMLVEELKLQSRVGLPYREVSVSGSVKAPGIYPLEPEMRISDLLRAGGQLSEEAYTLRAELARYQVVGGEYRVGEVIDVGTGATP